MCVVWMARCLRPQRTRLLDDKVTKLVKTYHNYHHVTETPDSKPVAKMLSFDDFARGLLSEEEESVMLASLGVGLGEGHDPVMQGADSSDDEGSDDSDVPPGPAIGTITASRFAIPDQFNIQPQPQAL